MSYSLDNLYDLIQKTLDPEMDSLMRSISRSDGSSSEYMRLPDTRDADLSPQEVSRLIALSSNKYSSACRLASLARAKFKIAEARYKHKLKTSMGMGKNADEREANAAQAASQEYENMVLAQVIVELCESIESSNRIASESSRRMLLAADQMFKSEGRFNDHSQSLTARDFTSY